MIHIAAESREHVPACLTRSITRAKDDIFVVDIETGLVSVLVVWLEIDLNTVPGIGIDLI